MELPSVEEERTSAYAKGTSATTALRGRSGSTTRTASAQPPEGAVNGYTALCCSTGYQERRDINRTGHRAGKGIVEEVPPKRVI